MTTSRSLIDSFSSFAVFNAGGYFQQWQTDRKLNQNMLVSIRHNQDLDTIETWSLFWYQCWMTEAKFIASPASVLLLTNPSPASGQHISQKVQVFVS